MSHQTDERGDPLTRTHDPARKTYSATESRQGRPGRPVLKVLLISLGLVFLVWAALELWGMRLPPGEPVDSTGAASTSEQLPKADPDIVEPTETDRDPTPQSGTGGETQRVTPDGTGQ